MADVDLKILISLMQGSQQALTGAGNDLKTLLGQIKQLDGASLKQLVAELQRLHSSADDSKEHLASLDEAVRNLAEGAKFLAGGFLGLESVRFFKDLADNAARAEVLETVLLVVGKNAGYTQQQLQDTDKAVQHLGITAQASRQALSQLIQANIDLSSATQLARGAQDLAVISGQNSSETFLRLVHAIELRSTLDLRSLGITINLRDAEEKYAISIGKTADQLNVRQQSAAFQAAAQEKLNQIQGSYIAALGDVGKQLTSLDRVYQNASTSLGKQLLPAYLAVVEQLTIFIEELTATSDAENAASDGGQSLGKSVSDIAQDFREAATFIVEHRTAIKDIIEAYVAFKTVSALVAFAQAGVTGSILKSTFAIGANITAMITGSTAATSYAVAETEVAASSTAMAFASGLAEGAVAELNATIAANPVGIFVIAVGSAVALLGHLVSVQKDLVPGAKWADVARGFVDGLNEDLRDLSSLLKGVLGDYGAFSDIKISSTKDLIAQGKQENDSSALGKGGIDGLLAQYRQALEAENDYNNKLVQAKRSGTIEAENAATEEAKKGHAARVAIEEALDKAENARGVDAARKAAGEKAAAQIKATAEAAQTREEAQTAQNKLLDGDTVAAGGGIQSKKFEEDIGNYKDQIKEFQEAGKGAYTTTAALSEGLKRLSESAKTPEDLKQLVGVVNQLKSTGGASGALKNASTDLAVANDKVLKDERSFTASLRTEGRTRIKDRSDALTESINLEAELLRTQNGVEENADKEGFDTGLISLDKYYENRRARIISAYNAEIALEQAHVAGLQDQLRVAEPEQRGGIKNQITAGQDKIRVDNAKLEASIADDINAKEKQRVELLRQVNDLKNETNSLYGGDDASIDKQIAKYEALRVKLKDVAGAAQAVDDAENAARFNDKEKKTDKTTNSVTDAIGAQVELDKARVGQAANNGQITPYEEQQLQLAIVQKQSIDIQNQIDADNQKIKDYQDKIAEINEQNLTRGKDDQIDTSGLDDQLSALQNKAVTLQAQLISVGDSARTAGQDIQRGFTDSVANGLDELLDHTTKVSKAFTDIGTSFEKQLTKMFSQNIASELSNKVAQLGKGDDGKGSSIFDTLGKLVGVDKTKSPRGDSAAHALYVQIVGGPTSVGTQQTVGGELVPNAGDPAPLGIADQVRQLSTGLTSGASGFFDTLGDASQAFSGSLGGGGSSLLGGALSSLGSLFGPSSIGSTANGVTPGADFGPGALGSIGSLGSIFQGAVPGFSSGGDVEGAGTGTSDSISANLSDGEFVIKSAEAKKWQPFLNMINSGGLDKMASLGKTSSAVPKFADGGLVSGTGPSPAGQASSGTMNVQLDPNALHMTLRDWLMNEVANQASRR